MAAILPSAHAPFSSHASSSTASSSIYTLPSSLPPPAHQSSRAHSSKPSSSPKFHVCAQCSKSYTKKSKLAAHVLAAHSTPGPSGTAPSPRPFPCSHPDCFESFNRKEHLEAHSRTHLPESDRPFACQKEGCKKRFWTEQHRRRHESSCGVTGGSHQCSECPENFKKETQLRAHVASVHSAPGTKPFPCTYPTCSKSFPTAQKLRAHVKVHDENRYSCLDPSHDETDRPTFATWTLLRDHTTEQHPPRCHYAECVDRPPFGSRKALRNHLKVHREREEDERLLGPEPEEEERGRKRRRSASVGEGSETPKLKRRRGTSVAGKDWHCGEALCGKSFKTKKALETHIDTAHYALRPWICPHSLTGECDKAYGHRHLLVRHLSKRHPGTVLGENPVPPSVAVKTDEEKREERRAETLRGMLTGKEFSNRPIPCPFSYGSLTEELLALLEVVEDADPKVADEEDGERCDYRCSRAYDLRRHLGTVHGVVVGEEKGKELAELLREDEA